MAAPHARLKPIVLGALWLQAIATAVALAQIAEPVPPPNSASEALETILGVPRSGELDSVWVLEGGELRGRVLNQKFQCHTAYGSFTLEARFIAAVTFGDAPQNLDTILTVNRNRLSGFLNDDIQLETTSGITTNLSKHQLRQVVLHLRDSEKRDSRTHRFVTLQNGDLLSGRFNVPEVLLSTPAGTRQVQVADVETIRFKKYSTNIHLQLANGNEEAGQLKQSSLTVALDCGPEVTLRRDQLKTLSARPGFVPTEVRQAFSVARTFASQIQPPPDSAVPPGLVWIPPGKFLMGSPSDERGRGSDEDPQTEVTISHGFWMAQREVTQGEFLAIMGSNPSQFQGDTNRPVEKVSWHEAREFCLRLTDQARIHDAVPAGHVYRLPTEAEWEYACRAGTTTRFSFGDDPTERVLSDYGWSIANSDLSSHPVGRLKPNPWGLYDMHGNVWEWCLDIWDSSYPGGGVTDYTGPGEGWLRVARGGSWLYVASFSRSANRDNYGPDNRCSDIGFRVVLAPPK
jgi:formylglycine-generating enzyme required for sulfatase activity